MPRPSDIRAAKALVRIYKRENKTPPQWAVSLSEQKPTKAAKPTDEEHRASTNNGVHRSAVTGKFVQSDRGSARASVSNVRTAARGGRKFGTHNDKLVAAMESAVELLSQDAQIKPTAETDGIDATLQRFLTDLDGDGWRMISAKDVPEAFAHKKLWTARDSDNSALPSAMIMREILELHHGFNGPPLLLVRDGEVVMVRLDSVDPSRVSLFRGDLAALSADDLPVGDRD